MFVIAALSQAAPRTRLQARVAALVAQFPAVRRGHIGFKFVDLTRTAVLAQENPSAFFVPASNAKLYTTAAALARLGPGYVFKTELRTSGNFSPGQTSLPDLELVGGGDPNLSGQLFPYTADAKPGDPLVPLRELAKKLADSGVKTINGDVTGVATRYPGDVYPDGWTIDDAIWYYGAPACALTFNENTVYVKVFPGELGELATLDIKPAGSPLIFLNQVLTIPGNQADVHVSRTPGSNEIVLWGTIGQTSSPDEDDMAVLDPARWAASELIGVLQEQGITVRGGARSQYAPLSETADGARPNVNSTLLATHQSVPLSQEIALTNKVSDNLHAEMLLRELGFVMQGLGSLKAGVDERNKFLQEIGISETGTGIALVDGSGLARQDLTTPESTVTLLRAMWNRPERDVWLASLPVGGIDGTLEHRFEKIRGAERVHAKTGSLAHVNSLSGYIETRQGHWIAFSIMVNNTAGHDADVRKFIDRLCGLFLSI